jgi:hypothetical protein
MSVTVGNLAYELVLQDKWYLGDLLGPAPVIEESLDEIAVRVTVDVNVVKGFPPIGPGLAIRLSGEPFGGGPMHVFVDGVIWRVSSRTKGVKQLTLTIYDRAIYLKSEEEYLFPAGLTATARIRKIVQDWNVPLGTVADTGVPLAKGVFRSNALYQIIDSSLAETIKKGGKPYRPRMVGKQLNLVEVGRNQPVWVLEPAVNIEELGQERSLENTVTQVKVLGQAEGEARSPVLALEKKDTDKYGTIQRLIRDPEITTASQAKTAALQELWGIDEVFPIAGIDINTIRAGDAVRLYSPGGVNTDYIVWAVRHELGSPGRMRVELAPLALVRRRLMR